MTRGENNWILCGFMGCGKTTVGQRLAALSGRPFVDMDAYIEQEAGRSVTEIFREEGEEGFRSRERAACRELAQSGGLVLATGGGALTFAANVEVLSRTGTIILLEVSPETLLKRLSADTTRPLLAGDDRETKLRTLYAARLPLYRQAADWSVNGDCPPDELALQLMKRLRAAENGAQKS